MRKVFATIFAIFLVLQAPLLAHEIGEHDQLIGPQNWQQLWRTWSWEPLTMIGLALTGWLYARGVRQIWRNAGVGHGVNRWEAACFAAGWFTLFIALISPLHPWGSVLFSAHMTQHELLMLVAAPLLVLGRPMVPFLRALRPNWASALARFSNERAWRATWGVISNAFVAWLVHAIVLWTWHIPALFRATLHSEFVHAIQHLSFLGSALLFWWAVIHAKRGVMSYGLAGLYMLTTAMHSGLLGALLTFASRAWYPEYSHTASWGLSPIEDQQLGGLIMWVPAGVVYIIAGLALFAGWIRESESRATATERATAPIATATATVVLLCLLNASCDEQKAPEDSTDVPGANPERGRLLIRNTGCVACHQIPGVKGIQSVLAPPLDHVGSRMYIAGVAQNTPENMVRFVQNPPSIAPRSAMPRMPLNDQDARDVAAYLYTLK